MQDDAMSAVGQLCGDVDDLAAEGGGGGARTLPADPPRNLDAFGPRSFVNAKRCESRLREHQAAAWGKTPARAAAQVLAEPYRVSCGS